LQISVKLAFPPNNFYHPNIWIILKEWKIYYSKRSFPTWTNSLVYLAFPNTTTLNLKISSYDFQSMFFISWFVIKFWYFKICHWNECFSKIFQVNSWVKISWIQKNILKNRKFICPM
jgi:hypothetical protein